MIVPVFNMESWVGDTIQSILDQTYRDFELIIVNDGSTDSTLKVIDNFIDYRIKVLHNTLNQGAVKALNKGIRASKGQFISNIAADDLWTKDSLEVRLNAIKDHSLICGQAVKIAQDTTLNEALLMATKPARRKRYFYGPTSLIRRDVFSQYGLFDENLIEKSDREMWVRLFGPDRQRRDRGTYKCLNQVIGMVRIRPESIQHSFKDKPLSYRQQVLETYKRLVDQRQNEITDVEFLKGDE